MILNSRELNRLDTLKKEDLVYTPKKGSIEAVALFSSQICNTPIAFISIINQRDEWFKSSIGLQEDEESLIKDLTYTSNLHDDFSKILEVEDLVKNSKLFNHPLIVKKNIIYYASVPLITPNGKNIGSISIMDRKKRKLTPKQKKALIELSFQLMGASDIRLSKTEIEKNILVFKKKNYAIEEFTNVAIENMTSPLNTITLLSEIINKNCSEELSSELNNYLSIIENSSQKMLNMVNEVKDFYNNIDLIALPKEEFLLKDLLDLINTQDLNFSFNNTDGNKIINANKLALKKIIDSQIVICMELVKMSTENHNISISFLEKKDTYWFTFTSDRAINKETLVRFSEEEENSFSSVSQTLISTLGGDKFITLTNDNKIVSFYIAK